MLAYHLRYRHEPTPHIFTRSCVVMESLPNVEVQQHWFGLKAMLLGSSLEVLLLSLLFCWVGTYHHILCNPFSHFFRHNWLKLPAAYTYSLLILLNLLIILLSTMILHVGFFGRLIALYRRNYDRVACLTTLGEELNEQKLDSWWNCR